MNNIKKWALQRKYPGLYGSDANETVSGFDQFLANILATIFNFIDFEIFGSWYRLRNWFQRIGTEIRLPVYKDGYTWIVWKLYKPFKITFYQPDHHGYCAPCHQIAVKNHDACSGDYDDFFHAEYVKKYEASIFSPSHLKYVHTKCTCEDLLFEPLEEYYASGGESGNPLCTGANSQWKLNEEIECRGLGVNPLKRFKKQLIGGDNA
ncbi:MAG: hypothetical protein VXA18_03815 [Gammaproteobacteria bacterium]